MAKRNLKLRSEQLEDRQLLHGGGLVEPPMPAERAMAVIERFDADESGDIVEAEVSERGWNRLQEVDADASGSVSVDELTVHFEAKALERAERIAERQAQREARRVDRTAALVDRIFAADMGDLGDGNGMLEASEVSEERWERYSQADADDDGSITRDEMTDYLNQRREARRQEREQMQEGEETDADADASADVDVGEAGAEERREDSRRRGPQRGRRG